MADETKAAISKVNETAEDYDIGPVFVITVPAEYTAKEMEEVADLACALPQNIIGAVMVVREGTSFSQIYSGPV